MSVSIADLTVAPTRDQIREKLLQVWREAEIPITDWESGATVRVLMELTAKALRDFMANARPAILAGGFPAVGPSASADAWLTLVADQWFGVTRTVATFTLQTVVLSRGADGLGSLTITAGNLVVYAPSTGNRYRAITGGTLTASSTLTITVQAESTQDTRNGVNFVDAANTITKLLTPIPGVTVNNTAPNFSAVSTTPSPTVGTGVVTVSGTPAASASVFDVRVTLSEQRSLAQIQTRINGAAWSAAGAMGASFTFAGGPTVNFTDDAGNPHGSFVAGEIYSFSSPGSPITVAGLDAETNTALLARCFAKFPDLTVAVAQEKRLVWARRANALVTRARVVADVSPGTVDVTIAGVSNPLSGGVVTAVQTYIDQHDAISNISVVAAATVTTLTPGGHVIAPALTLALVQAAASVAWTAYVLGTDIGGVVLLSKLAEILMDAGAIDVGTLAGGQLTLNTVAANFTLAANSVAQPADLVAGMTWHGV